MFNNLNWLFGTKSTRPSEPTTTPRTTTTVPKTTTSKITAPFPKVTDTYFATFGNNPTQYLTPMGGALANAVPAEGGAGYMYTPLSAFEEDGGGGYGYYGGGGDNKGGGKLKWKEAYTVEGAPEWWRGLLPTKFNAQSSYAAIYNAMIPFLSPEDQRTVGMHLQSIYDKPKAFGIYNPESNEYGTPPVEMTPEMMEQFTTGDRAKKALETLDKITALSGKKKGFGGAGYTFLRQLLTTMQDFGGGAVGAGNRQTRAEYNQLRSAVDPLLASMKGGEYQGLAQQLTSPFFTAGSTVPISKDASGRYVFGQPNRQLFG